MDIQTRPPTVRAVLQRGDRYLLVQHHYKNPANLGKWSIPGGRIDLDDPDWETTLRRELREEFQIEIEILRFLGTFYRDTQPHHIYHVRALTESLIPDPGEIAALDWFTLEQVIAHEAAGRLFHRFMLDAIRASAALEES